MPKRTFQYEHPAVGPVHLDPVAVRRDLVAATNGRLWELVGTARKMQENLAAIESSQPTDDDGLARKAAMTAEFTKALVAAEGRLADAAFKAFRLTPVKAEDGTGTLESEAMDVLKAYLGYAEGKE